MCLTGLVLGKATLNCVCVCACISVFSDYRSIYILIADHFENICIE